MQACLTPEELQSATAHLPTWEVEQEKELVKTLRFKDFRAAMAFVNQVAELAEQQNHHPDILIQYNQVLLRLSTHESNGLTQRDLRLAQAIDGLQTSH